MGTITRLYYNKIKILVNKIQDFLYKIIYKKTMENFFTFDGKKCHEIFFIYEYTVDEDDYQTLVKVKENQDNKTTEYIFINYDQFDEVDLLPLEIRNIIKE